MASIIQGLNYFAIGFSLMLMLMGCQGDHAPGKTPDGEPDFPGCEYVSDYCEK